MNEKKLREELMKVVNNFHKMKLNLKRVNEYCISQFLEIISLFLRLIQKELHLIEFLTIEFF